MLLLGLGYCAVGNREGLHSLVCTSLDVTCLHFPVTGRSQKSLQHCKNQIRYEKGSESQLPKSEGVQKAHGGKAAFTEAPEGSGGTPPSAAWFSVWVCLQLTLLEGGDPEQRVPRELSHPFHSVGNSKKMAVYESGSRFSPDTESAGTLILDFSTSRMLGNNFLFFISHRVCGIVLQQPR